MFIRKSNFFPLSVALLAVGFAIPVPTHAAEVSVPASIGSVRSDAGLRELVAVYGEYATLVRNQGAAGLLQMTAPNFAVKAPDARSLGKAGINGVTRVYRFADKTCRDASGGRKPSYSISIEPVEITPDTAVVYAAETFTGADGGMSTTIYWKQTWVKTATAQWKLSSLEDDKRSREQKATPTMQLTVGAATGEVLDFVALYQKYIDAVQAKGDAGFAQLAATNFVIRNEDGTNNKSSRRVATGGLYDDAKNKAITVRVQPVKIADDFAIMQVEESVADHITAEPGAKSVAITASWQWRQTWRKTPQGWKMASQQRADSPKPKRLQKSQYAFILSTEAQKNDPEGATQ